jgi:predicted RNA-binding Zn-ribbon protein involved in translation (DUF1610 family)
MNSGSKIIDDSFVELQCPNCGHSPIYKENSDAPTVYYCHGCDRGFDNLIQQKNWWGIEAHPSDELIHWSEVNYGAGTKAFEKDVVELRAAWDLLHSSPELIKASNLIAKRTADIERSEQAERDAGEDL